MSEWRPVEDGVYYGLGDVGVICLGKNGQDMTTNAYDKKGIWHTTTISNPENRRLCERVAEEPITVEALKREGWHHGDKRENSCEWYSNTPAGDPEPSIVIEIWPFGMEVWAWDDGDGCKFPNCKTMSDLAHLVRLLGGES